MISVPRTIRTAESGSWATMVANSPGIDARLSISSASSVCIREPFEGGHLALSVATTKASERRPPAMGEDASLDDFLDAGEDRGETTEERESDPADETDATDDATATSAADPEDGAAVEAGGDGGVPPAAVDDAATTYAWSPAGAPCQACGSTVDRRWRDDGALVCENCKDW